MLAVVALTLVFASSAIASEPDTIAGIVTSATTKAPIQGVEVCAGRFVYEQKCVSTGIDGTYVVPAPAVPVHVEFNAPSGGGLVYHTFYKGAYISSEATELTVPVGEVFSGIDEELLPEGRIEGAVTNASTKAPISGVEVCASPLAAWPEEPTCVSTDAQGIYEIDGLAPIQYQLKFKPGTLNYLPETPQREYALYPQVLAGSTTANVDVALPEGAQIEGRVSSAATGLPIAGVQACATGFGPALETKCATTDGEGRYLIDGLERSSYYVSFWPNRPYVGQRYEGGKPMLVNQGETLSDIDASVLTGTTISGDVTSANTGEPMKEVEVCLSERVREEFDGMAPREETSGYCTEPNNAGEYQITGVATSTDQVEFHPKPSDYEYENQYWNHVGVSTESTELHTTAGEDVTGIDATLNAKYGAIAGRVLGIPGGQALSDARACAQNLNNGQSRCANTNAQGEYEIKFLPSGRYSVEFSTPDQRPGYVPEFYDRKLSESEAEPVTVGAGRTTPEIDAELVERENAGSRISGIVSSISSQQPIAGIEVCAYDAAEEEGLFGRCAVTEAGGEYSISGLSSGEYLVEFSAPSASGLNYVAQYYSGTESLEQAIPVQVGPEAADIGIDAQMHEGGRIAGRVTDASTTMPVQGMFVCAYTEQAEACASTGENGQYTIAGLPAGEFEVEFSVPAESTLDYVKQYFEGQSSAKAATLVPVTIGETRAGIDAKLQLGGRISGRVTAAGSGPLSNVLVCALSSPSEAVACALTGRDGEYAIAGVPAGSYVVGFDAGKSYPVQYYDDKLSFSEAQAVTVAAGGTTSGIDPAMGRSDRAEAPVNTTPPVVSGTEAVGGALLCANGLWTGSPTPSLADQWLRDGAPITGATAGSYVVQEADVGHGLSCEVTAISIAGKASAISAAVAIPGGLSAPAPTTSSASPITTTRLAPDLTSPVPHVAITASKIVVSRSSVPARFKCSDAVCRGTVELTMQLPIEHHEAKTRISHRETLILAEGSFSLAKGDSAIVVLRLTAAGRQRLARAKRHPIAAVLVCSVQGGKTVTRAVVAS